MNYNKKKICQLDVKLTATAFNNVLHSGNASALQNTVVYAFTYVNNSSPVTYPWSMVSCSADCLVKVWDLRAIRNGAVYSLPGHKKAVFGVDFWSKNNVISWSNDGSLRQWDVTGKSPPVLLYEDLHYNLHGCDNRGAYVATCGGPSGTNHQPAYWNIHKIVSPTTNKSTPTKL